MRAFALFAAIAVAACVAAPSAVDATKPAGPSAAAADKASAPPARTFPRVAAVETYAIDPAHTQVLFEVDRFGFTHIFGAFTETTGKVVLDRDNPAKSTVQAVVKAASVQLGHAKRDAHVAGKTWLNADDFPELSFRSTAVTLIDADTAEVTGDLTLLGHTAAATMTVDLNKIGPDPASKRQAAGFSARLTVKRSDFGHRAAAELVGDEIAVRIEALGHLETPQS